MEEEGGRSNDVSRSRLGGASFDAANQPVHNRAIPPVPGLGLGKKSGATGHPLSTVLYVLYCPPPRRDERCTINHFLSSYSTVKEC